MNGDTTKEGRERVRVHLIDRLERQLRLTRPKRVSAEDHARGLDELEALLSYMGDDDLRALADGIIATRGIGTEWPRPATVLAMAKAIKRPDPSDSDMVRSYMRSSAGRRALDEGCHVELYMHLKGYRDGRGQFVGGRPPASEYDWTSIKVRADEHRRRAIRIAEARSNDRFVSADDDGFMAWYAARRERAEALISADRSEHAA